MSKAVTADDRDDELQTEHADDAVVRVITRGDPIRSWLAAVAPVTEQCKLRFDDDGMHVRAVDPANVAMVRLTVHADGFPGFNVDEDTVVGLDLDRFAKAVSWARKRGGDGDPVTIDVMTGPPRIRVGITRPDQGMKRRSEWFTINTDSVRDEPDIPRLGLPNMANPDPSALRDALRVIDDSNRHDYATISRDEATLVLSADADADSETIMMPSTAWGDDEAASSFFSIDYLADIADGLKKSKAEHVALSWGDEFPVQIDFEHQDWGFDGQYFIAPRIHDDD